MAVPDVNMPRLTIRLDPDLQRQLGRLAAATGRTRSDLVCEALRRQFALEQLGQLRRRIAPFAEARGYRTDEDVCRDVS
jgi:predicted transcriptional regulator